MQIIAHTMQYSGGAVCPPALQLRSYCDSDYEEYRRMYEDCFAEMRTALGLPVSCCDDREAMQRKRGKVFILEKDGVLAGSDGMAGDMCAHISPVFLRQKPAAACPAVALSSYLSKEKPKKPPQKSML